MSFTNGQVLKAEGTPGDSEAWDYLQLAENSDSQEYQQLLQAEFITIEAAYPNVENARAALVSTACGGRACNSVFMYLAYLYDERVMLHSVGLDLLDLDSIFSVTTNLDDGGSPIVTARVYQSWAEISEEIPKYINLAVTNDYGDRLTEERYLVGGTGFLSNGFSEKYLPMINQHSELFLGDSVLSAHVRSSITGRDYSELRGYLEYGGQMLLVKGKYLSSSGCIPGFCPSHQAAFVIDTSTNNFWAIWVNYNEEAIKSASTTSWDDTVYDWDIILRVLNNNPAQPENIAITYSEGAFSLTHPNR